MRLFKLPSSAHWLKALFLCFVLVFGATELDAQSDTLALDSIQIVVLAEETAALIPADYAALIIAINDKYSPEVEGANAIVANRELQSLGRQDRQLSRLTNYILARNNVLEGIKGIESKWRDQMADVVDFADKIESATNTVIELKKTLAEQRAGWVDNRDVLLYGDHPDEIHNYVDRAVDTIDHFLEVSAVAIDTFTVMYTDVVELLLNSKRHVDELKDLRQARVAALITEQNAYLWTVGPSYDTEAFRSSVEYLKTVGMDDARYYFREHSGKLWQLLAWFVGFIVMFLWTKRRSLKLADDEEPELVRNVHILKQPITMAIFATLIVATLSLPNIPPLMQYVSSVVFLYCIVAILSRMMKGRTAWIGYMLTAMFLIVQFSEFISGGEHEARWLTFGMSVILTYIMFWVRRNRKLLMQDHQPGRWPRLFVLLSIPLLIAGVLAIIANLIGYSRAASLINTGTTYTLIIGLLLLSMFKSLMSVVYHFFHTTFASNSLIIKEDGDRIFTGMTNVLRNAIFIVYLYFCLNFFLLWEPIRDLFYSILEFGYTFGTVEITVGDLVNVVVIIFSFWIVAAILRMVLRKEVFYRVNMPRGVGNAVASLTHYTIVVVGVFLALASAGFETRHLGIMAGALGVGIGFGLQNIVNNFLSGLILVFERPITVDDVIEVDGELGVVTSIGIRSSKIRKYNGDEVIVPNADLISKRVTNRTLSDTRRRYTMTFETGRGVDPDRVIEVITQAAQNAPGILEDPPVKAYFQGMGAQTIKFYVNYWGSGNFLDLMSDVEKAVYKALEQEGVPMPVPVQIEIQKDD